MINLIVATHGKMSEETVNLTKMVLGESEQLDFGAVSFRLQIFLKII